MSVEETLKGVPLFQDLADERLKELAAVGKTVAWAANQAVFSEGDGPDNLYVILDGRVKVYRQGADGGEVVLGTLAKGDCFGEMALFDQAPRSASVVALDRCEFFVLGRTAFLDLLSQSPRLISEALAGISGKVRATNEKLLLEIVEKQALRVAMERERYRSLAQMVAGVAHEINTPLGIVNTAVSVLAESLTPERVAALAPDGDSEEARELQENIPEALRLIAGNLARATKLVQTFKNLSVSQITDVREKQDLFSLVDEIVGLYKPRARKANLQIEIHDRLAAGRKEWDGYPGYLSQILLNLLSNVERYAYPEGQGGKVEIVLSADYENKQPSYTLAVRDFGAGIDAADLPRVSEAFFTTGREKGGTGLGMAIVHNLVTDALKGTMDIQSKRGEGTSVTITFPQVIPGE
jgi:signal transduction histidine kinase